MLRPEDAVEQTALLPPQKRLFSHDVGEFGLHPCQTICQHAKLPFYDQVALEHGDRRCHRFRVRVRHRSRGGDSNQEGGDSNRGGLVRRRTVEEPKSTREPPSRKCNEMTPTISIVLRCAQPDTRTNPPTPNLTPNTPRPTQPNTDHPTRHPTRRPTQPHNP